MDWLPIALSVFVALTYGLLGWFHLRPGSAAHRLPEEVQQVARFGRPLGAAALVAAAGVLVGIRFEVVAVIANGLLVIAAGALFVLQFRARAPWPTIALIVASFLLACFHLGFHD